jgi:hypothetical protein
MNDGQNKEYGPLGLKGMAGKFTCSSHGLPNPVASSKHSPSLFVLYSIFAPVALHAHTPDQTLELALLWQPPPSHRSLYDLPCRNCCRNVDYPLGTVPNTHSLPPIPKSSDLHQPGPVSLNLLFAEPLVI